MRTNKRLVVLGLALAMVFSFAAMSVAAETPKFKVYKNIVEFAAVKDVVDGKTEGVIIDARPKRPKYDKGHISGALSQSWSKFKRGKVNVMPKDKGTLVIFYCGGVKCPLSHKSAFKAEKMGYTNVAVYADGMPDWKKKGGKVAKPAKKGSQKSSGAMKLKPGKGEGTVDMVVFEEIVTKTPDKIYLIDARDPAEYKEAHIKGSINIPSDADGVEKKLGALKTDKPIVFICSTGARSGELYYMMIEEIKPKEKDMIYFVDATMEYKKDGSFTIKPN